MTLMVGQYFGLLMPISLKKDSEIIATITFLPFSTLKLCSTAKRRPGRDSPLRAGFRHILALLVRPTVPEI